MRPPGRVPETPCDSPPRAQSCPGRARTALETPEGRVAWLVQPPPGHPAAGAGPPGSLSVALSTREPQWAGRAASRPLSPAPAPRRRRLRPPRGARRADSARQHAPWPQACAASRGVASGCSWVSRIGSRPPRTPAAATRPHRVRPSSVPSAGRPSGRSGPGSQEAPGRGRGPRRAAPSCGERGSLEGHRGGRGVPKGTGQLSLHRGTHWFSGGKLRRAGPPPAPLCPRSNCVSASAGFLRRPYVGKVWGRHWAGRISGNQNPLSRN